jgi:hypothetical protein
MSWLISWNGIPNSISLQTQVLKSKFVCIVTGDMRPAHEAQWTPAASDCMITEIKVMSPLVSFVFA